MILELAIEGISLNVFIFKPFSNKRRNKRRGAYWRAALIRGRRLYRNLDFMCGAYLEGGAYWRKYGNNKNIMR